jgi:predicted ATPase
MVLSQTDWERLATAAQNAETANGVRRTAWSVLSGAPGSGKTALAQRIASSGYTVIEDPGRAILLEDSLRGVPSSQTRRDYLAFQRRILSRALLTMQTTDPREPVFFDYGVAEALAFLRGKGLPWEDEFVSAAVQVRFKRVFVLDPLDLSVSAIHDSLRTEDAALRRDIHALILDVYAAIGAQPIQVPAASLQNRLSLVLKEPFDSTT